MSAKAIYNDFNDQFCQTLVTQTGMSLGEYSAMIVAGQNPAFPSHVAQLVKRLVKRRRRGKDIKSGDIDALLDMVTEYMQYQALSGRDRVVYSRNLVNKIIPTLSAVDIDNTGEKAIHKLVLTDEQKNEIRTLVADVI